MSHKLRQVVKTFRLTVSVLVSLTTPVILVSTTNTYVSLKIVVSLKLLD
jgi:hypothetical protein